MWGWGSGAWDFFFGIWGLGSGVRSEEKNRFIKLTNTTAWVFEIIGLVRFSARPQICLLCGS